MGIKILIDTNAYLRFYDQKSSGFKILLDSIETIKSDVFVSQQIRDEVLRNKLNVIKNSIIELKKGLKISSATFPEGFKEPEVIDWNRKIRELSKNEDELEKLGNSILSMVALSTDTVSKTLESLFSSAAIPTEQEKILARERKEFGNPPGKKSDPIGDQITWTQFLNKIESGDSIYLISQDGDFYTKSGDGNIYLNPYLLSELILKGIKTENIFVFDKLVTGLVKIKLVKKSMVLPDEEEIKKIEKEEERGISLKIVQNNVSAYGTSATSGSDGIADMFKDLGIDL